MPETVLTTATPEWGDCLQREAQWAVAQARTRVMRTLRRYVEDEIVIPEGKYIGTKFRIHRQPFSGLYFDAVDTGNWNRYAVTGCVQSGKTLDAVVIPALWHLDEHKETVVCGVPTMDIAKDKWEQEFRPVFEASPRLRGLIPKRGSGSRGGRFESITLTNGSTLKFMSGMGGDEKRSAFTSRVIVVTEADKMDTAGEASREADPITQLENRTASYGDDKRIYLECTTSIESGRIWREYKGGTDSKIVCPCPHCGAWVAPGREHLVGWEDAETEVEAAEQATFICPNCTAVHSEGDRLSMVDDCRLVHKGQSIDASGRVQGDVPKTKTLGFRWDAFLNMFWSPGFIASGEWRAKRERDERNVERERRQFFWALPSEPDEFDATPLDLDVVAKRRGDKPLPRGLAPADVEHISMGIDVGKEQLHWAAIAWQSKCRGTVIDFGTVGVKHRLMALELAIIDALERLNTSRIEIGWPVDGGEQRAPGWVFVDSKWQTAAVYKFVRDANKKARRFLPAAGYGGGQQPGFRKYNRPDKQNKNIQHIGEEYHVVYQAKESQYAARIDADYWKTWLRHRLSTEPPGSPGGIVLFEALAGEHRNYLAQLDSEDQRHEEVPGRGLVTRWFNRTGRQNHWLDATYLACAAGHLCGVRIVPEKTVQAVPRESRPVVTLPDGRPYLITER